MASSPVAPDALLLDAEADRLRLAFAAAQTRETAWALLEAEGALASRRAVQGARAERAALVRCLCAAHCPVLDAGLLTEILREAPTVYALMLNPSLSDAAWEGLIRWGVQAIQSGDETLITAAADRLVAAAEAGHLTARDAAVERLITLARPRGRSAVAAHRCAHAARVVCVLPDVTGAHLERLAAQGFLPSPALVTHPHATPAVWRAAMAHPDLQPEVVRALLEHPVASVQLWDDLRTWCATRPVTDLRVWAALGAAAPVGGAHAAVTAATPRGAAIVLAVLEAMSPVQRGEVVAREIAPLLMHERDPELCARLGFAMADMRRTPTSRPGPGARGR